MWNSQLIQVYLYPGQKDFNFLISFFAPRCSMMLFRRSRMLCRRPVNFSILTKSSESRSTVTPKLIQHHSSVLFCLFQLAHSVV